MALDNIDELNVKNASPFPTALRYGLIGGVITIIVSFISYLIGMETTMGKTLGMLNILAWIIIPILAIRAHRDTDLGGFISHGRSLGTGVLAAIVMGLLGAIWSIVLYKIIDPGMAERMTEMVIEQWEAAGMSDEQIEDMLPMASKFTGLIPTMISSVLGSAIIGFIVSLIGGAVMKKERGLA